jgi:methionine-S-sulfoxide reductase
MNQSHAQDAPQQTAKAIFAGGCFWCMESVFDYEDGIIATISGYTGGHTENPTYEQIGTGSTGHYEALEVTYNPALVSYEKLLEVFWYNIDPTDSNGQFADRGSQYHTAVFYKDDAQKQLAEASKIRIAKTLDQEVKTKILPASHFYPAEDYHQNYHKENTFRYKMYYKGSGRPDRLEELWPDNKKESD